MNSLSRGIRRIAEGEAAAAPCGWNRYCLFVGVVPPSNLPFASGRERVSFPFDARPPAIRRVYVREIILTFVETFHEYVHE